MLGTKRRGGRESGPLFVCGQLENVYHLQNMETSFTLVQYIIYTIGTYKYIIIMHRYYNIDTIRAEY